MRRVLVFCLLAWASFGSGCAVNPVSGNPDFVLMSAAEEIRLGEEYHQQILKQYRLYEDPVLQEYVSALGQKLATKSHRSELKFHFTVLDSPEVNAFALPGGYVYVTRGIMAYLNSEAELAGVIGHEIGHVTARHSVRRHSQATVTGILGAVFSAYVGAGSENLFGALGQAIVSGYGREHELEADRLGAEYLAKVGYDPENMIEVIGVLKSQEEFAKQQAEQEGREARTYHGVFASHPDNDQRLKEVIRAARKYSAAAKLADNREVYLQKIDGMVYGHSASEGVIRKGVLYHADLDFKLAAPHGWKIHNLPDRIILAAPGETALLQLIYEGNKASETRKDFMQAVRAGKLEGLQEFATEADHGYSGIMHGSSPWGAQKIRYAVWYRESNAFLFAAAAKTEAERQKLDAQFVEIVRGFSRLSTMEKELAKPLRISLAPAAAYSQLAEKSFLNEAALRLLNGDFPEIQTRTRKQLKIVR